MPKSAIFLYFCAHITCITNDRPSTTHDNRQPRITENKQLYAYDTDLLTCLNVGSKEQKIGMHPALNPNVKYTSVCLFLGTQRTPKTYHFNTKKKDRMTQITQTKVHSLSVRFLETHRTLRKNFYPGTAKHSACLFLRT